MDDSKTTGTISAFATTVCILVSSSFASLLVFASCLVCGLSLMGLDIDPKTYGTAPIFTILIALSFSLGIGTFLSKYILLGNPGAFMAAVFPLITHPKIFCNFAVFTIIFVPVALGGLAGCYLNRYSVHRAKISKNKTSKSLTFARLVTLAICTLPIFMLMPVESRYWVVIIIFMVQLALMLAPAAMGVERRAQRHVTQQLCFETIPSNPG